MKIGFEALCHSSVALLFVLASCSVVTASGSHRVRTSNRHGSPIPSKYYGAIPDSRVGTYSDSFVATWCDGYTFNHDGYSTINYTEQ